MSTTENWELKGFAHQKTGETTVNTLKDLEVSLNLSLDIIFVCHTQPEAGPSLIKFYTGAE